MECKSRGFDFHSRCNVSHFHHVDDIDYVAPQSVFCLRVTSLISPISIYTLHHSLFFFLFTRYITHCSFFYLHVTPLTVPFSIYKLHHSPFLFLFTSYITHCSFFYLHVTSLLGSFLMTSFVSYLGLTPPPPPSQHTQKDI